MPPPDCCRPRRAHERHALAAIPCRLPPPAQVASRARSPACATAPSASQASQLLQQVQAGTLGDPQQAFASLGGELPVALGKGKASTALAAVRGLYGVATRLLNSSDVPTILQVWGVCRGGE